MKFKLPLGKLRSFKFGKLRSKRKLVILGVIILVSGFVFYFKSWFVASIVNGYPITRLAVMREAELENGGAALDTLVTKRLILQEAKKKEIDVGSAEVSSEIKKIEDQLTAQGQTLDAALASQGMTMADLEERMKFQLLVTKLVGNIDVTDEEIAKYMTDNKDLLSADIKKEDVVAQLEQEKISEKVQELIKNLKSSAQLHYFVNF